MVIGCGALEMSDPALVKQTRELLSRVLTAIEDLDSWDFMPPRERFLAPGWGFATLSRCAYPPYRLALGLLPATEASRLNAGGSHDPQAKEDADTGPGDDFAPPRKQVALSLLCVGLAMFLAALSQTVVASIMAPIVADLGGFDRYTWPSTSYLVAATVAYPIVGRLSDIYGRRPFLIAGIVTFIAGSALVGLSESMNQIIGFRLVQASGAAS